MANYLFLVVIFLFAAIGLASVYKFFKFNKFKVAVIYLIYLLLTLILTITYFNLRDSLSLDELSYFINGLKKLNGFAILILILNLGVIISSIISYVKVINLEKIKKTKENTK